MAASILHLRFVRKANNNRRIETKKEFATNFALLKLIRIIEIIDEKF